MSEKLINLTGLTEYDSKIKEYIGNLPKTFTGILDTDSYNSITYLDYGIYLMKPGSCISTNIDGGPVTVDESCNGILFIGKDTNGDKYKSYTLFTEKATTKLDNINTKSYFSEQGLLITGYWNNTKDNVIDLGKIQTTLTAGNNITISNNTISATGVTDVKVNGTSVVKDGIADINISVEDGKLVIK